MVRWRIYREGIILWFVSNEGRHYSLKIWYFTLYQILILFGEYLGIVVGQYFLSESTPVASSKAIEIVLTLSSKTCLTSSRASNPRKQVGTDNAFYDSVSRVTNHHFCHILFIKSKSTTSNVQWKRGELGSTFWRDECQRVCRHTLKPP